MGKTVVQVGNRFYALGKDYVVAKDVKQVKQVIELCEERKITLLIAVTPDRIKN